MESTNRVLMYLQPTCQCHRIKRRLHELHNICAPIEAASGNMVVFWEPAADEVLETGESTELTLLLEVNPEACAISADIPLHTVCELRRVAERLNDAAARIDREFQEGGVA